MGDIIEPTGNEFSVPEAYQGEGWAKDITSYPEVWAKLAGSEKLIGQRVEGKIDLLKENSSPEEVKTFYKAIGKPDEAKSYEFNREGQSEQLKQFNSDEMDNTVKEIFHKWHLTNEQATGIQKDYEAVMESKIIEQFEAQKKLDSDFEEMTTKAFGNDKDAIMESTKLLLEKFAPEGYDDKILSLDNEVLTILAGTINNLKKTYISEEAFSSLLGDKKPSGGGSEAELRAQARTLMASPEWSDPMTPKNKEVREQVDELYEQIGKIQ